MGAKGRRNMEHTTRYYDLRIVVEPLEGGGDYAFMATSPDLAGLIVVGDTITEVLALTPSVAAALIASLRAAGDPLPGLAG